MDDQETGDYVTLLENEQYLYNLVKDLRDKLMPHWDEFKKLVGDEIADKLDAAAAEGSDPRLSA